MPRLPPALLLTLAGCADRPSAPPLVAEAVYRNPAAGVRFLAPDGWEMVGRADLPPGPLPHPVVLVTYIEATGDRPGEFELVAADLPEDADLGAFLAGYRIGGQKWDDNPAAEPVAVNGAPATRYTFTRGKKKGEFKREVTAFRRGGRVYFFAITYGATDPAHRDQARKSVESVTWADGG
ncbi:MAG: hypothetical protein K2X82_25125 [Gemmataceae bacterium]|nr:hypothetical protein [Gemmataceae bacterium]